MVPTYRTNSVWFAYRGEIEPAWHRYRTMGVSSSISPISVTLYFIILLYTGKPAPHINNTVLRLFSLEIIETYIQTHVRSKRSCNYNLSHCFQPIDWPVNYRDKTNRDFIIRVYPRFKQFLAFSLNSHLLRVSFLLQFDWPLHYTYEKL